MSMCIYVHCVQLLWLWEFLFVGTHGGPDACVVRGVWRNVMQHPPTLAQGWPATELHASKANQPHDPTRAGCKKLPTRGFTMLFNIVFSYFQATLCGINLTIISSRDIFTDYMCKLIYKVHLHNLVSI